MAGVMRDADGLERRATALVKAGYVDAARICIVAPHMVDTRRSPGGGDAERYACAASVNGLSDPEDILKDLQQFSGSSMAAEWWRKSMGSDMDHLRKVSPLRQADHVRIPILLLHGIERQRRTRGAVAFHEQKAALAKRNVRYVELGGDDHWLSSASTRTQMLNELETFLAQSLKK